MVSKRWELDIEVTDAPTTLRRSPDGAVFECREHDGRRFWARLSSGTSCPAYIGNRDIGQLPTIYTPT